jgi:hypothetical protein
MAKIIIFGRHSVRPSSSFLFLLKGGLRGRNRRVGFFRVSEEKKLTNLGFNPFYQLANLAPFFCG